MGIREEQKEKRREEILEAGLNLFIRKGYSSTKIKDIADCAGMSVGLMFHYFKSKENLYEELIRYGLSGPMKIMTLTDMEPIAFFEEAAKQILQYIKAQTFTAKMFVLMGQAYYNEAAPQGVKDMLRDFDIYTPTAQLIQKGQVNGTIREGDSLALSLTYWSTIQGVAELMAARPDLPGPESDWIVDILRRRV